MRAFTDTRLALRLIRGAGRRDVLRLLTMALGVGLATFAVLVGLTAPRVAAKAHDVELDRTPVASAESSADPVGGLQIETSRATLEDRQWTRAVVSGVRPDAPLPPGLTSWPPVGRTIASPALVRLAHDDPQIATLIGPLTAERIGWDGLTSPDELFSYTVSPTRTGARAPGQEGGGHAPVTGFGGSGSPGGSGLLLILEVAILVLTPATIFLATALRLSAASRRRRSFALSLAGMSPSRAARLYSREMVLVAAIGYALGAGAYAAIQGRLGSSGLLGVSWWPEQGRLGGALLLVTGVIAVALVSKVARRSMAAVTAKSRAQRMRGSSRWQVWAAVVLALPAGGFLVITSVLGLARPSDVWASDPHALMIVGSVIAAVAAVVLGLPALIGSLAERIAHRTSPPVALGLRGASHRLPAGQRLVAFVACAVMLAGLSAAFVDSMRRVAFGDPDEATISFAVADLPQGSTWSDKLPDGPLTIETTMQGADGPFTVVVGNCAGVHSQSAVVFTRPGACTDTIQRGSGGAGGGAPQDFDVAGRSVDIPAGAEQTANVVWDLKYPLDKAGWIDELADGDATYWISRSDASYQRTLAALTKQFPGLEVDAGMKNPDQYAEYRQQVGTIRAAVGLGLLLSACSFLLTAIESRWERARSLAALAAIGTRQRDLRIANLVEFTFPVMVAVVPSVAVGVLGGWAYVSVNGSDAMFADQVWAASLAGAAVCVLLAAAAGWATGGAVFRREALTDT